MPVLRKVSAAEFRRELAGLLDKRDSGAFSDDKMQQLAIDLYVALAVLFNRRKLDAKTIWTRLDSAVQRGCSAANGGDVTALVNACCQHVMAAANGMVAPEVQGLLFPILQMDSDAAYAFVRFVEQRRFTLLAFAQKAWGERKELLKIAREIERAQEEEAAE